MYQLPGAQVVGMHENKKSHSGTEQDLRPRCGDSLSEVVDKSLLQRRACATRRSRLAGQVRDQARLVRVEATGTGGSTGCRGGRLELLLCSADCNRLVCVAALGKVFADDIIDKLFGKKASSVSVLSDAHC